MNRTRPIFLDTDIGSDPDDAMTLVQMKGAGVDLRGISLGYGPTKLRESIARRYLSELRWQIPLAPGRNDTLSGEKIWLSGREARTLGPLAHFSARSVDAVSFLAREIRNSPEPCTLLCIAPLTNVAELLTLDPQLRHKIRELVIMGGDFSHGKPEHNFKSDVTAANIVLSSGIPTTVVGLDVTQQMKMGKAEIEVIRKAGSVGQMLAGEIYDWWDFWNEEWSVPHDPVALVALLRPELFTFSDKGSISVGAKGKNLGVSKFVVGNGSCRIVETYDVDKVRSIILEQIIEGAKVNAAN